jgi:hypothetical protein
MTAPAQVFGRRDRGTIYTTRWPASENHTTHDTSAAGDRKQFNRHFPDERTIRPSGGSVTADPGVLQQFCRQRCTSRSLIATQPTASLQLTREGGGHF